MNRYFSSFFITIILYLLVTFFLFYVFADTLVVEEKKPEEVRISIKYMMVQQESIPVPHLVEPTPIELPPEKKTKTIVEKKIDKPKKEKKVFEEIIQKNKQLIKEPITRVETEVIPVTDKKILEEKQSEPKTIINENKEYLDKNLSLIRSLINENVKYPFKAKKLFIEGIVLVKFKILEDGSIQNIQIMEGPSILKSSTIEAIEEASKSFPKSDIAIEIQIPIEYKLI